MEKGGKMTKEQWLNQTIQFDTWGRPPSLADVPLTYGSREKAFKLRRYDEAEIILRFNLERYPDSWNVYDSMGELQLKMGNMGIAEGLYVKSLD